MRPAEITGKRDLTMHLWHRDHLPKECSFMDVDGSECCPACKTWLFLLEFTQSKDFKATTMIRVNAARHGCGAYLIRYEPSSEPHPDFPGTASADIVAAWVTDLFSRNVSGRLTSDGLASWWQSTWQREMLRHKNSEIDRRNGHGCQGAWMRPAPAAPREARDA